MPMVPCPECKVPQFYRNKPKAGSKRRKCAGCRAKHLQRAQLREEDRAERKAQRSVTCDVCNCDMQLPSTRSASASFHTCERCGDYSRCAKQLTAFNEAQGESDCAMPAEPDSQPGDTPDEPKPS